MEMEEIEEKKEKKEEEEEGGRKEGEPRVWLHCFPHGSPQFSRGMGIGRAGRVWF